MRVSRQNQHLELASRLLRQPFPEPFHIELLVDMNIADPWLLMCRLDAPNSSCRADACGCLTTKPSPPSVVARFCSGYLWDGSRINATEHIHSMAQDEGASKSHDKRLTGPRAPAKTPSEFVRIYSGDLAQMNLPSWWSSSFLYESRCYAKADVLCQRDDLNIIPCQRAKEARQVLVENAI